MYHYTRDLKHSRYPNIKGLDVNLFRKQLDYMKSNFNVVTMEQVMATVKGEDSLPEKALLLTFDDGYADNYQVALPLLEEYGLQGSFFVSAKTFTEHKLMDVNKIHYILASANIFELVDDVKKEMNFYRGTEFDFASTEELYNEYAISNRFDTKETIFVKRMLQTVLPENLRSIISSNLFKKYVGITEEQLAYELYMTREQIKTMKNHGMYIGIHGYDHYWLANLSKEQMENDIYKALDSMDEFIDRNCWVMNYPYGSYNENVMNYAKEKGACIGLTTKVGIARIGQDANMELPRFDCNDFPPVSEKYKENYIVKS